MSALPFLKMQAQGNDFVILDGLTHELPELDEDFVRRISERRFGIGCDQLLVMQPDDHADFGLRIFNNDGSEAANCGNGLRCVAEAWMRRQRAEAARIALADRVVSASRSDAGIAVEMGPATIGETTGAHVDVEIGNAHRVFFEATEDFPHDRNVEIVTGQIADHVYIDIIERGAGRTLACGSGACAVTAAIWHVEGHQRPQTIEMPGGEVRVSGSPDNLILEGEVALVFSGEYLG
ncbi:MAG: diaminopimelate epimerase [Deltaproteobacteria bacterium]|nr:MAG: diaminopimelate epimerase [Deltaproteobacteria bacterium]